MAAVGRDDAAGLVVGVAGASSSRGAVLTAGPAGLFAGAIAMGVTYGIGSLIGASGI